MNEQPEALRLADILTADAYWSPMLGEHAAAELRRLSALVAACEPYLKDGETPAERIERERRDTEAVCRLYAKERERNAELLEALENLVNRCNSDFVYAADETVIAAEAAIERLHRAAIAKAEGEPK